MKIISFGISTILIVSIIKYTYYFDDYSNFLNDVLQYDKQVLEIVTLLYNTDYKDMAELYSTMYIGTYDINSLWYLNLFNWSETCFTRKEILDRLNYWRITNKIPKPYSDYEKGIIST